MNSQEGKDAGNDSSEGNNVNPTQSTSNVSSTNLSEDTEATQVSGSKGAITGKNLKFQPHWQKKYSRINYYSVINGMLCQYSVAENLGGQGWLEPLHFLTCGAAEPPT